MTNTENARACLSRLTLVAGLTIGAGAAGAAGVETAEACSLFQLTLESPNGWQVAHDVLERADGRIVTIGLSDGGVQGSTDVHVVEFAPDGTVLASWAYGSPDFDAGYSAVETADGGLAIAAITQAGPFTQRIAIIRTDASGAIVWARLFTGSGPGSPNFPETIDLGPIIKQAPNKDLVVIGDSLGNPVLIRVREDGTPVYVAEFNALVLPEHQLNRVTFTDLEIAENGDAVITGTGRFIGLGGLPDRRTVLLRVEEGTPFGIVYAWAALATADGIGVYPQGGYGLDIHRETREIYVASEAFDIERQSRGLQLMRVDAGGSVMNATLLLPQDFGQMANPGFASVDVEEAAGSRSARVAVGGHAVGGLDILPALFAFTEDAKFERAQTYVGPGRFHGVEIQSAGPGIALAGAAGTGNLDLLLVHASDLGDAGDCEKPYDPRVLEAAVEPQALLVDITEGESTPWQIAELPREERTAFLCRAPCGCPADWEGDGDVDVNDLLAFLGAFRAGAADMDGDGDTDVNDLLAFLGAFRQGC